MRYIDLMASISCPLQLSPKITKMSLLILVTQPDSMAESLHMYDIQKRFENSNGLESQAMYPTDF